MHTSSTSNASNPTDGVQTVSVDNLIDAGSAPRPLGRGILLYSGEHASEGEPGTSPPAVSPLNNQEFSLTQQGAALDDDDSDKWSQIASAGSEAPDDLESDFEETDSAYFSCEEGETGSDASSLDSGDGFERFNSSSENPSDSEFDPEDARPSELNVAMNNGLLSTIVPQ